ncbi:MAG: ATP-dependent zinc metalloprotease FtsH [Pirellulales bacterium]|nr:ATP-dependent zinc metalloprotease FtsH [Pirellulales bacterium]
MDKTPQDRPTEPQKSGTNRIWIFLLFFLLLLFIFNSANQPPVAKYSDLETWLSIPAKPGNRARDIVGRDAIELVTIDQQTNQAVIKFKKDESNPIKVLPIGSKVETEVDVVQVVIPDAEGTSDLKTLLDGEGKDQQFAKIPYQYSPQDGTASIIMFIAIMLPIAILIFFWISYRRSQNQFMGGGFLSGFGKSNAKRYDQEEEPITFKDVAGQKAAKSDLQEIVEFLSSPDKFQRLGGRVPKGEILNGPPGTGKTLLARAVAGEAGVPFYSINGSEFIQMFVGVGASRVRDLFQQAKESSPAIIFIDEIDAVGRQRGAGVGGGHDEREQTLNQILGEMDGFSTNDSVIVVAATNRPDVLDPALLRPGRFDRHVTVGKPTQKGRRDIFKVHVRHVPLADDVDLLRLAAGTVGLTGADIRNMVNEAALWAARHDKNCVEMDDFDYARDKILMGAKREEHLTADDKEKTAYHEAGHTLASWFLKGADRVHKVTIIPRGRSLGSTQMLPEEDRVSMSATKLKDHLVVLLAGRAAETLIYDETAVGAENDLERATSTARRMVTRWGMSEKLGPVSYKLSDEDPFLGREMHEQRQFSEHTMEVIDSEVSALLHDAESRANNLLVEYRDELESLTARLVAEEELSEVQIADTIGPSVHPTPEADPEEALPSPPDNPTKPGAVAGESDALEGSALEESGAIASQQINESNSDDDEVPGGNY